MKVFINDTFCPANSVRVDSLETNQDNNLKLIPYKIVIPKDDFYRDFNPEYESILPELNETAINCLNDSQLILCCEYFKLIIFDKYFKKLPDDEMYRYTLNDWDKVIIENDNIVISGQAYPINRSGCKVWAYILAWVFVIIILVFFYFMWLAYQSLMSF